jgi:hypothetical protein
LPAPRIGRSNAGLSERSGTVDAALATASTSPISAVCSSTCRVKRLERAHARAWPPPSTASSCAGSGRGGIDPETRLELVVQDRSLFPLHES